MSVLGIDIGGANLKYATEAGRWLDRPFPMWTESGSLAERLAADVALFEGTRTLAVTMTGELADCFAGRAEGVRYIVDQVVRCAPSFAPQRIWFYGTDGRFHDAERATSHWELIAASNWHALARCVGKRIAPDALLIDVGTTTTDVIAIRGEEVLTASTTDFSRLCDGSLVYIGCRRTPVCALVSHLRLRGKTVPVMNEVFATIDDARLLLGVQVEDGEDCLTADSHPRDRLHAKVRIARMLGLDSGQISDLEAQQLAKQIHDAAVDVIGASLETWWQRLQQETGADPICILSGHGHDLVALPTEAVVTDLRERLSGGLSRGAPAWAVAVLAAER